MLTRTLPLFFLVIIGLAFFFELAKHKQSTNEIEFWQYWSGAERKPLEDLVAKFNAENHGFKVKMLSISMPRKKILMSVAGNVPPDLMHLDGDMVSDFALRGALLDLDVITSSLRGAHKRDVAIQEYNAFTPVFVSMLKINGTQWALPLMPTCEAMHVNKTLLNKYGLDVPQNLNDIVRAFDTIQGSNTVGWLPSWPPWAGQFIPVVFGGRWARDGQVTANSAENVAAWTWVQDNFARKIPRDKLAEFTEGLRSYQSPDNPFYTGRIAIENNGVWERNLANIFAPKIEIAIANFPGKVTQATYVTIDALAIPRGAKHPEQALEFMHWLLRQDNLEYLALAQQKFTPLKQHSEEFFAKHPNPYIKTFIDLAQSPNATYFPQLAFVQRYKREIKNSYQKMLRMELSAQEALDELQTKMQSVSANN